jgi:hypothetical protein
VTSHALLCKQLDSQELAERRQDEQAGKRAELHWLPRGREAAAVRDSTGVPSFDLLSLDFDTLYPEVEHLLSACAFHAQPTCALRVLTHNPLRS